MVDDTTVQPQETPQEEPGLIAGVERTPEVDERLKEFGIDLEPSPEEVAAEEEKKKAAEVEEAKKREEEEQAKKLEEEAKQKELEAQKAKENLPEEEKLSISDEDAQALVEKATGKKKGEEKYPWELENREPTEKEVLDYVSEKSAEIVLEKQAAKEKQQKEEQEAEEQKKTEIRTAWEKEWGRQIDGLEGAGYLPKVVNKDDPKDSGNIARTELWNEAAKLGMMNLTEVYLLHILPKKGKQPAGANAPISRGESADTTPPENDGDYFYDDIHGKDPSDFASEVVVK